MSIVTGSDDRSSDSEQSEVEAPARTRGKKILTKGQIEAYKAAGAGKREERRLAREANKAKLVGSLYAEDDDQVDNNVSTTVTQTQSYELSEASDAYHANLVDNLLSKPKRVEKKPKYDAKTQAKFTERKKSEQARYLERRKARTDKSKFAEAE